ADFPVPGGHLLRQPFDQGVELGRARDDGGVVGLLVQDGDAGGVIAPVLEAPQALHDDGRGRTLPQVADDPAHLSLLSSQTEPAPTMRAHWARLDVERRPADEGYGDGCGILTMKTWTWTDLGLTS